MITHSLWSLTHYDGFWATFSEFGNSLKMIGCPARYWNLGYIKILDHIGLRSQPELFNFAKSSSYHFFFGEKIVTIFLSFTKITKGAIIQIVKDQTTNVATVFEAHKKRREKVSPDSKSSGRSLRPIWDRFLKNFLWSSQSLSKVSEFTVILIGLPVVEQTFEETSIRSSL